MKNILTEIARDISLHPTSRKKSAEVRDIANRKRLAENYIKVTHTKKGIIYRLIEKIKK